MPVTKEAHRWAPIRSPVRILVYVNTHAMVIQSSNHHRAIYTFGSVAPCLVLITPRRREHTELESKNIIGKQSFLLTCKLPAARINWKEVRCLYTFARFSLHKRCERLYRQLGVTFAFTRCNYRSINLRLNFGLWVIPDITVRVQWGAAEDLSCILLFRLLYSPESWLVVYVIVGYIDDASTTPDSHSCSLS